MRKPTDAGRSASGTTVLPNICEIASKQDLTAVARYELKSLGNGTIGGVTSRAKRDPAKVLNSFVLSIISLPHGRGPAWKQFHTSD